MKILYTISEGEYDDYCIHSVFESLEQAKEFVQAWNEKVKPSYNEVYIEEIKLFEPGEVPKYIFTYRCMILISEDGIVQVHSEKCQICGEWNSDRYFKMPPKELEVRFWGKKAGAHVIAPFQEEIDSFMKRVDGKHIDILNDYHVVYRGKNES